MRLFSTAVAFAASVMAMSASQPADGQEPLLYPVPVADNWTGFYVGAFGGWAGGDIEATELSSPIFGLYFPPGDPYGFSADSVVGGGHVGYDLQWHQFVVGVAGEVGSLDLSGSVTDPNSLPTGAPVTSFESQLYGAVTGRVGFAFNRVLVYAKGGLALLDASGSTIDTCGRSFCGPDSIEAKGDDVLTGWTIGGGVDVALTDRWRAGSEYRYFSFEDLEVGGITNRGGAFAQDIEANFHSVRAFVSYHW